MESLQSSQADPAPITPEILAELLRVEVPSGTILVQGIVKKVTPWSNGDRAYVYGRLALGRASISFRTHPEFAPNEGDAVTMKGVLQIRPVMNPEGDWRATHEITLVGSVVGTWAPRKKVEPVLKLPVRDERVPLDEFIAEHGIENLVILTTTTARADITQTLSDAEVMGRPEFVEANFGSASEFLATVKSLHQRGYLAGLAIARGGGSGQELIAGSREIIKALIDLRVPFYVAFGHATDVALIDRFADQAFHAPSGLAAEIARSVKKAFFRNAQDRQADELAQLVEGLDTSLKALQGNLQRATYVHRGGVSFSWPVIIALVLSIFTLVSAWVRYM